MSVFVFAARLLRMDAPATARHTQDVRIYEAYEVNLKPRYHNRAYVTQENLGNPSSVLRS
jgi:hypothetical protein